MVVILLGDIRNISSVGVGPQVPLLLMIFTSAWGEVAGKIFIKELGAMQVRYSSRNLVLSQD